MGRKGAKLILMCDADGHMQEDEKGQFPYDGSVPSFKGHIRGLQASGVICMNHASQ